MIRPLQLYLLLVGFQLGQLIWYAPRLPETVASHFNAAGEPDGWMSRGVFLGFLAGISLLYVALFLGAAALVRRAPAAVVSLPNKEYWLAPERAAATRRAIAGELFKVAAATQVLMIVITQLTVEVGLGRRQTLSDVSWVALVVYVGIVIWWLIALFRRFRLPAGAGETGAGEGGGQIEPD
jgi:uncharacterized membrane protein